MTIAPRAMWTTRPPTLANPWHLLGHAHGKGTAAGTALIARWVLLRGTGAALKMQRLRQQAQRQPSARSRRVQTSWIRPSACSRGSSLSWRQSSVATAAQRSQPKLQARAPAQGRWLTPRLWRRTRRRPGPEGSRCRLRRPGPGVLAAQRHKGRRSIPPADGTAARRPRRRQWWIEEVEAQWSWSSRPCRQRSVR